MELLCIKLNSVMLTVLVFCSTSSLFINVSSFSFLDGVRFFSMAKTLAKNYEKNTNLTFVWIDAEPFPSVSMKDENHLLIN